MKLWMFLFASFLLFQTGYCQFGKNKVQYKDHKWYYVQTKHFDVYFYDEGLSVAEFTIKAAEDALDSIQSILKYQISNRLSLIVYNSHNDFQETNTTDYSLSQGIGGFTEPFKNRIVFPFEGDFKKFRHVIHHELVHGVMRDMLYGGTVQNIISRGITLSLPHWYHEGMAEYISSGWETSSDMFIREAIVSDFLPDISGLSGYFGYRGGQAIFHYIAEKYGRDKIGEILAKTQGVNSLNDGMKAALGINLEELNEKWKKDLRLRYWPDVAKYKYVEDFARKLTGDKKTYGFYNTSPAISPLGDKVAFITDRDIYFNIYVLSAFDGKILKRVVESGRTNDFEELNVLTPTISWAPDNKRIAVSTKKSGYDRVFIVDTESGEETLLPFSFPGITSVSWAPDADKIAFIGSDGKQSDIYVYRFSSNQTENLTNDIFTEQDPAWNPNSESIFYASDRGHIEGTPETDFDLFSHNFNQRDIFRLDLSTKTVSRLTFDELSDELSPVCSPDGNEILFISDKSGINNIYKLQINDSSHAASPVTNSISGINQLSVSRDGKKLVFSALSDGAYNVYLINNPFTLPAAANELEPTYFISHRKELLASNNNSKNISPAKDTLAVLPIASDSVASVSDTAATRKQIEIFTGNFIVPEDTSQSNKKFSSRLIFGKSNAVLDTTSSESLFTRKLDEEGNYLRNPYRINFSPDIVYANAGYSTFYGLLGTTILTFSDVLGNHRLTGVTSMQIDLKNSDYGLAYYYLPGRLNYGVEGFHTARILRINRNGFNNLHRFRNYGLVLSASYPINTFYRIDFGLSYLNLTAENLDNVNDPVRKSRFLIPSVGFVHDNTLFGYTSPIEGTRYSFNIFGNPGISKSRQSFVSLNWDYRTYFRFLFDNSFVIRLSGGYSGGANPQRFFLGGTDNWINRTFATGELPLDDPSDFAFLSPAMPMRGFQYAEKIGTKYSLLNLELRMPLLRYIFNSPIPLLAQSILNTVFIDAGTAWTENNKLKLIGKDLNGTKKTQDLLLGFGAGARVYFLFFLTRLDIAWSYDFDKFSRPKYYISIGTDF